MHFFKPLPLLYKPVFIIFSLVISAGLSAQMRQVNVDNATNPVIDIKKISFFSPAQGYVAYSNSIGYSSDSGHSITKKLITIGNVDYNGYSVNLTFGFGISGVKAFDQNTMLVYGDYGFVPSILSSTDGGNTFKLIYHSQYDPLQLRTGITDMIFPQDNFTGYAVDADRILKTTNQGITWTVVDIDPGSYFSHVEAPDNNTVVAISPATLITNSNKAVMSSDGGASWKPLIMPQTANPALNYVYFLNPTTGWLNMTDYNIGGMIFKTTDGGTTWIRLNQPDADPFSFSMMKFSDSQTGYALTSTYTTYKTLDGGTTWEPLPRDNNYAYLFYSHYDLQLFSPTQIWAGGGHGFLELSTNGGGIPLATPYFSIDASDYETNSQIHLVNYSRTGYSYQWLLNNSPISTSYNVTYVHDVNVVTDTIQLIVTNGNYHDTATKTWTYTPGVKIYSFSPQRAAKGQVVTIQVDGVAGIKGVSFGGVPAAGFYFTSQTSIAATVDTGSSGSLTITTQEGRAIVPGFTFIPAPEINSVNPQSAISGTTVIISGNHFDSATNVSFGGTPAASFSVVSPNSISVVVPSGPSGSIMVTTAGGIDTLDGFLSIPTISGFTPLHGTQGTLLQITGSSLTDISDVSVGGVPVLSFTANSSTLLTAVVSTGTSGTVVIKKTGASASMPGFTWYPPPVISSFAPASGPVGTSVSITGTGFDPVAANNTVWFGAVKAVITGGNATGLIVTIPVGASFEPIKVTTHNLTAYTSHPFLVTFVGGGSITPNTFKSIFTVADQSKGNQDIRLSDVDGDGKTDVIISAYGVENSANSGLFIYLNTGSGNNISLAAPYEIKYGQYGNLAVGDIDGDGKNDIVISGQDSLVTFRNLSSPGNISFVRSYTNTHQGSSIVALVDLDGDGKADLVANSVVYRNTSDSASFSFADPVQINPSGAFNMVLVDLDGDGKPDLVSPGFDRISILKNNSTKGNLIFSGMPDVLLDISGSITTGDMDGDGKADLIETDNVGSRIVVLRNTSTGGVINFDKEKDFIAVSTPYGIQISDLDGDGKPDVATVLIDNSVSVLKNISTPGNLIFQPEVRYTPGYYNGTHLLAIGDMNGDGKNDIVAISETDRSIHIHINQAAAEPEIISFDPTSAFTGEMVTLKGKSFTGTTAVKFGDTDATSFTVVSDSVIQAIVGNGTAGKITITNAWGTGERDGFVFGHPPVITGFSPASAVIGGTVVISGNYFDPQATNNIVYFGSVRANVAAASSNSLTVTVPVSAGLQPISVTVKNLTAYSSQDFSATTPSAPDEISANTFADKMDRPNGGRGAVADLDGDGKPDLVFARGSDGISIAGNTSTPHQLSFASNVDIPGDKPSSGILTGDLDGDGKPDFVSYSYDSSTVSFYLNTSTSGHFSALFVSTKYTSPTTAWPMDGFITDLDGDGKPDLIIANYEARTISVFKNQSTPGHILFADRVDYAAGWYPNGVRVRDVDGDGKPEIVAVISTNYFSIFKNTSTIGTISFDTRMDFALDEYGAGLEMKDMDGDGKLDILIPNTNGNSISLFKNNSTPGQISIGSKNNINVNYGPPGVAAANLDKDDKPEMLTYGAFQTNLFSVLKNNGGNTFDNKSNFTLSGDVSAASIADLDGDSVNDIIIYQYGGITSIFMAGKDSTLHIKICAGTDTILHSDVLGNSYQWQVNNGNGILALQDDENYTGTNTKDLTIHQAPAYFNNYVYTCVADGSHYSKSISLGVSDASVPSVSISSDKNDICYGDPVRFSSSVENAGASPVYTWMLNGTKAGGNQDYFVSSVLKNKDSITLMIKSNLVCAIPDSAISQVLYMAVKPNPQITVSISGNIIVDSGVVTTIQTSVTDTAGLGFSIQWQDSTQQHNWQAIAGATQTEINYQVFATGYKLRCLIDFSTNCQSSNEVISNVLIFTLNSPAAPNSGGSIRVYPNPVSDKLTIDSLNLADEWETLEVRSVGTGQLLMNQSIRGLSSVTIDVSDLPKGTYVVVLKGSTSNPRNFKFIKE